MGLWDSIKGSVNPLNTGANWDLSYGTISGQHLGDQASGGGTDSWKDLIPGLGDARAAEIQNRQNVAAADRAMQFSERMSSTAYQRAMADMKKAGLNPMLAYSQGGASTPSGVSPTFNSTSKSKFGETALAAFTGIQGTATAKQQADTQQSQAESTIQLNKATAAKQVADAEKTQVETKIARKNVPKAELEAKLSKKATDAVEKLINGVTTSGKERSRAGDVVDTFKKGINYFFGPKQQKGAQPVQPKRIQKNGNF